MRYLFIFAVFLITSCRPVNVYEKQVSFPKQQWTKNQNAVLFFDINDSSAHQLFVIVRHTEQFPFNKLMMQLTIQDTARHALKTMNIDAPLTDASGNWLGEQMDDIFYSRIKINPAIFLKPGPYRFVLRHRMKENVLPHILNIGIAIDQ